MGPETLGQNKMLAIIDYGMGNLRSVEKAFKLLCRNVVISNEIKEIKKADYLVLPGVGAFSDGIKNLNKGGLAETLAEEVLKNKKPFLGICLGMQFLARDSEEFGKHKGLGWLDASVKAFNFKGNILKIPHVGWNSINIKKDCPLFSGVKRNADFYFVHSYYLACDSDDIVTATCNYGFDFPAAIQKDNIFATQFHPEKSQISGLKILENFLEYA